MLVFSLIIAPLRHHEARSLEMSRYYCHNARSGSKAGIEQEAEMRRLGKAGLLVVAAVGVLAAGLSGCGLGRRTGSSLDRLEAVIDAKPRLRAVIAREQMDYDRSASRVSYGDFKGMNAALSDASQCHKAIAFLNDTGFNEDVLSSVVGAEVACTGKTSIHHVEAVLADNDPLRSAIEADVASTSKMSDPRSGRITQHIEAMQSAERLNRTGIDYEALHAVVKAQMNCRKVDLSENS
jgi:hypothetical protein